MALLEVKDLQTHFFTREGVVRAVDGVSFQVEKGKTLGIVGESGCGKSVTALSIMRLLPEPPAKIVGGSVDFDGIDLVSLPEKSLEDVRGDEISMIFQDPMTSLNPTLKIGTQIMETMEEHLGYDKGQARKRAIELLEEVHIPNAKNRLNDYPHRFSGGMRQRVMIALALSCNPSILIADEPTTALDVTIQAQILTLIRRLQEETGTAMMLITHDLGVVAEVADEVAVMYAGRVVESGPVEAIFDDPQHPYTIGLMGSVPSLGRRQGRLATIRGTVPPAELMPKGCRFTPRCPFSDSHCANDPPPLAEIRPGHKARCWYAPLEVHRGAA